MDKEELDPEKKKQIFHIFLAVFITCLFFVILNFGIPIKILVLIVFSIILTFSTVFFCVWCLRILEEKRIIELSRKDYNEEEQQQGFFEKAKKTAKRYRSTITSACAPLVPKEGPPTISSTEEFELPDLKEEPEAAPLKEKKEATDLTENAQPE